MPQYPPSFSTENVSLAGVFSGGLEMLFYILLFIFTLHAVFLAYHWFSYGDSTRMSVLALACYLCGGAILFLTFSFGLSTL